MQLSRVDFPKLQLLVQADFRDDCSQGLVNDVYFKGKSVSTSPVPLELGRIQYKNYTNEKCITHRFSLKVDVTAKFQLEFWCVTIFKRVPGIL